MNPKLEDLLIKKLEGNNSSPQTTAQDQISNLYEQLQKRSVAEKIEKDFMQVFKGTGLNTDQNEYEQGQSLKSLVSKDSLVTALGVTMGAQVAALLPINLTGVGLGIGGISQIAVGVLLRKFIFKTGIGSKFADGVTLGGLALAVGGFTKGINLSSIGLGGGGGNTQNAGNQFAE